MDKQALEEAAELDKLLTTPGCPKLPQTSSLAQAYCLQRMIEEAYRLFEGPDNRGAREAFSNVVIVGLFVSTRQKMALAREEVNTLVERLEAAKTPDPDA